MFLVIEYYLGEWGIYYKGKEPMGGVSVCVFHKDGMHGEYVYDGVMVQ